MMTMDATDFEKDIALERLVVAKGIELARRDKTLVGRCPFAQHADPTALIIDPKSNTWTCSAGCGSGGVVEWVMKTEGVSHKQAVALLRADFLPEPGEVVQRSTRTRLAALVEPDDPDEVVLRRVVDYYHATLKSSPQALAWLHDRGLRDPELVDHFHIGFADRTLGYRLPRGNRRAGRAIREQLRRLGIYRDTGHEQFRGCVVVPLLDEGGGIVQIVGRRIGDGNEDLTLNDQDGGVFNPAGFVEGQKLILAADVFDALTWWSAGFRNVTSTVGKGTLPPAVKELLIARSIRLVWLALRRNNTGDQMAETLGAELRGLGVEVHRVVFPMGLDASDVARQSNAPGEALGALLRASCWVSPPMPPAPAKPPLEASTRLEAPSPTVPPPAPPPGPAPGPAPGPDPGPAATVPGDDDHQVVIEFGDRRWRIRGLEHNTSHSSLKVNLLVSRGDAAAFHVDVIELYSARQRRAFLHAAAEDVDVEERVLKADLGKVLLRLEDVQDERIRQALEPKVAAVEIDEADRLAALKFLKDPNLLDNILTDFETLGIVGEQNNKMVAYLAATSRKLASPLAVVIQSSSAAGKSSLMEAVLRLIPDEDKHSFSAMTGRSLYYLGEQELAHKVLSIAEEEGASQATYALKVLQSEGHLTIASTGKEAKTGRLTTQTYQVSGPIALLMTTTQIDLDEELLSRFLVLTVDEGREQTRAIHDAQRHRKTLEGLVQTKQAEQVVKVHHNAQRLLRPLRVVIPQAGELKYADHALRARRDHGKFLALIQAVSLLRQYQKDIKECDHGGIRLKYIEADATDIEIATRLAHEVLGRTLDDLPPGTRKLLAALQGYVTGEADTQGIDPCDVRFTRRELREALNWGNTQLKVHLRRLVDFEFLVIHRGGEPGCRLAYELVYQGEGQDGERFLPGLPGDTTKPIGRGQEADRSAPGRPPVGPKSAGGRATETTPNPTPEKENPPAVTEAPGKRSIGGAQVPEPRSRKSRS